MEYSNNEQNINNVNDLIQFDENLQNNSVMDTTEFGEFQEPVTNENLQNNSVMDTTEFGEFQEPVTNENLQNNSVMDTTEFGEFQEPVTNNNVQNVVDEFMQENNDMCIDEELNIDQSENIMQINQDNIQVLQEPVQVLQEPVQVLQEPVQVLQEPIQVLQEPATNIYDDYSETDSDSDDEEEPLMKDNQTSTYNQSSTYNQTYSAPQNLYCSPKEAMVELIHQFTKDTQLTNMIVNKVDVNDVGHVTSFFENINALGYKVKYNSTYTLVNAVVNELKALNLPNTSSLFTTMINELSKYKNVKGYFRTHSDLTPVELFNQYFYGRTLDSYLNNLSSGSNLNDQEIFMFLLVVSRVFNIEIHWLNSRPSHYFIDINGCDDPDKEIPVIAVGTIDTVGHVVLRRFDNVSTNKELIAKRPQNELIEIVNAVDPPTGSKVFEAYPEKKPDTKGCMVM
jgi:hypothetical protein